MWTPIIGSTGLRCTSDDLSPVTPASAQYPLTRGWRRAAQQWWAHLVVPDPGHVERLVVGRRLGLDHRLHLQRRVAHAVRHLGQHVHRRRQQQRLQRLRHQLQVRVAAAQHQHRARQTPAQHRQLAVPLLVRRYLAGRVAVNAFQCGCETRRVLTGLSEDVASVFKSTSTFIFAVIAILSMTCGWTKTVQQLQCLSSYKIQILHSNRW